EKQLLNHMADKEQGLLPGRNNCAGNMSQPEKKLQEAICVLLVELCERFTFFGIICNMTLFCTVNLGYHNYQAAIVNMCFVGSSMLTPVLVGWIAECLVGRTKFVCICMFLLFLGTALLPDVAFPIEDVYFDRRHILPTLTKREQKVVFYFALLKASLGIGSISAIICPLSAYHLEVCGAKELLSFFQLIGNFMFYWLVNLNSAVVFASISYIQLSVTRNLAILTPFVSTLMAMITIHMVQDEMIYKPKTESSLLTPLGVITAALKACCLCYRYFAGGKANWLDHAKENHGGHCSETQVESTKLLAKLLPLFAFQILYRMCVMQVGTQLLKTLEICCGVFTSVSPGAWAESSEVTKAIFIFVDLNTGEMLRFSQGGCFVAWVVGLDVGQLSAALSMVVAGFSEIHRKHFPQVEQTLSKEVLLVSSMPCFHLAPQHILLGVAEALVTPSCSLLSFWLVPARTRGISMHFLSLFNGAGCFMGAFLVQTAHAGSQG
ncbi:S15A5 protein, partial [Eubucco bourcierii]|nr:S15A5 protein [Eubucco bourcierii]